MLSKNCGAGGPLFEDKRVHGSTQCGNIGLRGIYQNDCQPLPQAFRPRPKFPENMPSYGGCGGGSMTSWHNWAGGEPLHITKWAFVGAIADEAAYEFCDSYPEVV